MSQRDTRDDIAEMVTVAQAAETLGVSPSTIWRWIDAGRLRAFRIGPKAIRIRRRDLAASVRPAGQREAQGSRHRARAAGPSTVSPEARRVLAVLDAADELGKRMLLRRGGRLLPDSTPVIRAARLSRPPAARPRRSRDA